ncbi:hypothetical protein ACFX1R_028643 [Malus domestica]|nr:gibberellin-regulated protein 11-like isoform X2 [Malus domestica]
MALLSRTFMASMLVSFMLVQYFTEAADHQFEMMGVNESLSPQPPTIDCRVACEGRCKLSKRPHLCKRACGSCCHKCSCVPPGTSGNYESCPCYFNLKTPRQTRKCP